MDIGNPVAYNDTIVRRFAVMTLVWGIVGTGLGALLAAQLYWPALNFDIPWLTYGRLRPLHTNAVIFAFGGSALFAACYYIVQRTARARLFSDRLASFTFWGWQAVIVLAALTLPMGITQGKEYAELEWPIDVLIAVVWVAFAVVFFGTLARRQERHVYVSNWYFGAYIVAIAVLHIVNSLAIPVGLAESYPVYSGAVDAMVQWWYGHNAVGFMLTAGFLGMMFYFVPKQARAPLWSYRLSIINFWAMISIYMWAGPHHLQYTALPDWVQTLGMAFSLILLIPSWGTMVNGLMTLRGAGARLREDPILRFMLWAVLFYGLSTLEGSTLAIRSFNAVSHYTDWTVGHVHSGALGWVAMISIGSLYVLFPRLAGVDALYSTGLVRTHLRLHLAGTFVYMIALWIAGIGQGLMWRETDAGGQLVYSFLDALEFTYPWYLARLVGGLLVVAGMVVMAYNVARTFGLARDHAPVAAPAPA